MNDALLSRLKSVECPDATYPARDPALVFARALGSKLWDAEGREYIDLCAGFGVLALGHNAPPLAEACARRANPGGAGLPPPVTHGMGDVYASSAKVDVLERLTALFPAKGARAALALTGGQAVELAVKTAILATKRTGFIAFDGGYHGLDLGILPLTSRPGFRAPFAAWLPERAVQRLPWQSGRAALDEAVFALAAAGHPAAAIIVEPVQGRAGVRPATLPWLRELRAAADRHGLLLIYDEIFTGLGRAGRMTFAHEVPCDLLCLGKALGGGLPLSAVVGTPVAMNAWPESTGEALHTGTFFGHPMTCEVAAATLARITEDRLPERAATFGRDVRHELSSYLKRHPLVREVRGEGLMLAIEFSEAGFGARLMDVLRQRGVVALCSGDKGQSLSLTPALNIQENDMEIAIERLFDSLDQLARA